MGAAFAIVRHPGHLGAVLEAWERQWLAGVPAREGLMGVWCEDLRGHDDAGALPTMERLMLTAELGPIEAVECGGRWAICQLSDVTPDSRQHVLDALGRTVWPSGPGGPRAAWLEAPSQRSGAAVAAEHLQVAPVPDTFRMFVDVEGGRVPEAGARAEGTARVGRHAQANRQDEGGRAQGRREPTLQP